MVIVSHMRARANLTKTQARHVTAFLQATNGWPAAPVVPAEAGGVAPTGGAAELSGEAVQRLLDYVRRLSEGDGGPPG
jgi:hypothetical protein